jgi:hypothetical protein
MQVMISGDERGRALIKAVDSLNLQDLTNASDEQIKAVTNLVWEIKRLFYALLKGKASDVLGNLNIGGEAKLSATLVADLTAGIPRDVIISAQQLWLPNLATEMGKRPVRGDQEQNGWTTMTTEPTPAISAPPEEPSGQDARQETPTLSPQPSGRGAAGIAKRDPPPCLVSVLGQCLMFKGADDPAEAGPPEGVAGKSDNANAKPDGRKETPSAGDLPAAMRAGVKDARSAANPEAVAGKTDTANAKPDDGTKTLSANEHAQAKGADQTDDLLFPTEEELRAIKAHDKDAEKSAQPDGGVSTDAASKADTNAPANAPAASGTQPAEPRTSVTPMISIASDVDPESWAEYGGWYQQDYTIFYRPTGHKDKFLYSWLFLTGPQAPKGDKSPAAEVFDSLTSKDAQGSCTKCHSVDDIQSKGRVVNFSPTSVASKQGRFTNFIHEPHFGILENRGCLTCHKLEEARPYLKSYEQGNPQTFVSNFGAVKKDLCQTCHTSSMARQDCLLCHQYHVNGVVTPIISTRIPTE